jgi:hypothetical protein
MELTEADLPAQGQVEAGEEDCWSIPGFGWTSSLDSVEVHPLGSLQISRRSDDDGVQHIDFQNVCQLLREKVPTGFMSESQLENFPSAAQAAAEQGLSQAAIKEIIESGGRSNNRQLTWNIMLIPKHKRFHLHAHPNVELIYCVKGTLYEHRLLNNGTEGVESSLQVDPVDPTIGPDLAQYTKCSGLKNSSGCDTSTLRFSKRSLQTGTFLVNPTHSIHLSYSNREGAALLVLWGGGHANIVGDRIPEGLVEGFDFS